MKTAVRFILVSAQVLVLALGATAQLSPKGSKDPLMQILEKIQKAQIAAGKRDQKPLMELLANDALIVDSSGVLTKKELFESRKSYRIELSEMTQFHLVKLTDHSWTLTYHLHEKGILNGKSFDNLESVSTAWTKEGTDYLCHLIQKTALR